MVFCCSISLLFLRHLSFYLALIRYLSLSLSFAISLSLSFYCSLCCTRYVDDTRKLLHKMLPHGRQVGRDCTPSLTTDPSYPPHRVRPCFGSPPAIGGTQRRADSFSFRFFFLFFFASLRFFFSNSSQLFLPLSLSLSFSFSLPAFCLFSLILSAYKCRTMRDDLKK